MIQTSRRNFLGGLGALIAAPAIVRASVLMPIKEVIHLPTLNIGDVITFEGVESINQITKLRTGRLRQFIVTVAFNPTSNYDLPAIYPAMIPAGDHYETVVKIPPELIINQVWKSPIT